MHRIADASLGHRDIKSVGATHCTTGRRPTTQCMYRWIASKRYLYFVRDVEKEFFPGRPARDGIGHVSV